MAREYARIVTAIWDDPDFLALTGNAQRMFMALLTQPKITMIGSLDFIPKRWASQVADMAVADIETAITELEGARFVMVDRDVDELVIRTFVKGDGSAKSGPQRAAMWSAWSALASPRLRREVLDHLPDEAWKGPDDRGRGATPATAEALRDAPSDAPSADPSNGVTDGVRYYQSLNQNPEPGTGNPPATAGADASPPDGGTPPDEGIKTDPEIIDELCALLADRIEHHREGDRPKITKTWRKDLDLLLRRGPTDVDPPAPISPEKLRVSIDALFGPLAARDTSGFCWADQVQSPGALRKHWTRIGQAARAKRQTSGGSVEDLAERARKRAAADEAMRRASRRADRANPLAEALGGER